MRPDEIAKQFEALGLVPVGKGRCRARSYLESEWTRWGQGVRDAGLAGTQ